jgi:predicted  nucleic acid-binding Zn-ribbon protein
MVRAPSFCLAILSMSLCCWAPEALAAVDPSLMPGLIAQLNAAAGDIASARDSANAAKKEMDERRAESDRWKAQLAPIDKDKAAFDLQVKDYEGQWAALKIRVDAHNARCPDGAVSDDTALVASCNAEAAVGNQELANLKAWKARLDQGEADFATRYDTINKVIMQLDVRIGELATTYMDNVKRYNRDAATLTDLRKQINGQ